MFAEILTFIISEIVTRLMRVISHIVAILSPGIAAELAASAAFLRLRADALLLACGSVCLGLFVVQCAKRVDEMMWDSGGYGWLAESMLEAFIELNGIDAKCAATLRGPMLFLTPI